jgi:hypothetical protein
LLAAEGVGVWAWAKVQQDAETFQASPGKARLGQAP